MSSNYSINWNAVVSGVTGGGVGVFLVTSSGGAYVPATTSNYAASPVVRAVIITPVNTTTNTASVQFNGDIPASISGIANTASGYARLNLTTGMAEWVAAYGPTDIPLGPCVNAVIQLDFTDASTGASGYTPYTLAELDENAADNSAALQAAFDAVEPGGKILIPAGNYYLTESVNGLYANGFHGVSVEGTGNSIDSGTAAVRFYWNRARESGSAASLSCTYQGAQDPVYTWTHYQYLTLTGVSGASSSWVGKQITIGGAARSYWNAIAIVVQYNSATSVVIAMPMASTNVAVVGNTDANNGSITWEVWTDMFNIQSRDTSWRGIQFLTIGGATRKPGSLLSFTYAPSGQVSTHHKIENCYMGSSDAVSLARQCVQVGKDYLPAVGSGLPYEVTEGGYRRPFCPYQNDYLHMTNVNFYYADRAVFTGNPTGQERSNIAFLCGFNFLDRGFDALGRFTNSAEQLDKPGSLAFDISYSSWGAISDVFITVGAPNAQWTLHGCYAENIQNMLARCNNIGGTSFRPFRMSDCYFDIVQQSSTGWFEWINGPISIQRCVFKLNAVDPVTNPNGPADFTMFARTGGNTYMTVEDCILPDPAETGVDILQFSGSNRGVIVQKNCKQWTIGTAIVTLLDDEEYVYNPNAALGGGKHIQKIKSLSAGWDPCVNFIGTVTVSGASTTGTWTFSTAESSATAIVAFVGPSVSETGTPAADSYLVTKQSVLTTGVTVTVYAAPGVGNSVTFPVFIVRTA